ncbi:hypothetical protein Goklo_024286, partial [Gossypium klotzschianum]|nr:hypothetical protein [Gossypium klotzschianum]
RGVLLWAPPRPGFVKFNVDGVAKGCPRLTRCGGTQRLLSHGSSKKTKDYGIYGIFKEIDKNKLEIGDVDFAHVQREANGMMDGLAKAGSLFLFVQGLVVILLVLRLLPLFRLFGFASSLLALCSMPLFLRGAVETEGSQIDLEVEVPRLIEHHLVDIRMLSIG